MPTPPPSSTGPSPPAMIPPANPFSIAPPSVRNTSLAAPSLSLTGSRSPGYSSNSYSHSTSPSTGSGSLPDVHNHDGSGMTISPIQISSASLNAQKRAYRQRRKDPSCDACRERKVKCDATETSACSECSSRNHKCQFTKETNRRMSSIKQVQDLQSRVAELTQMNTHLRSQSASDNGAEAERVDSQRRHSEVRTGLLPAPHRITPPNMRNFGHVRENIRIHSQGIFNTTQKHTAGPSSPAGRASAVPELPSQADSARLSRSYLDAIHEWYPVVYWPAFQNEVDEVYRSRTLESVPRVWRGLFFAVLACGSLQRGGDQHGYMSSEGTAFFQTAVQNLTPWTHDLAIEHVQAALLLSIFASENNWRSVGSMWLSSAIRVAQELSLHCDMGAGSSVDVETKRRLWWALYVRDRITSLDSNRPMMIHEDDCDTALPSAVEDRYLQQQTYSRTPPHARPYTGNLAIIHITQLHSRIYQALKSSVIQPQTLQSLDEQFRAKIMMLPEAYHNRSQAALDTNALPPLFALLSAQFHLYRRNMTPLCRAPERTEALSRCVSVAQDTARYISRVLYNPSTDKSRLALIASTTVCLHIWRCTLVLCFRGDYDAALMCLHLSSAMASTRAINTACCTNTAFVLEQLLGRVRSGAGSPQHLELDEEILAYVSADAQGSPEHAWVWAGANPSSRLDEQMRDAGPAPCDEWARIEHLIVQLREEKSPRSAAYFPAQHNPVKRVQLAPDAKAGRGEASGQSGSSRISIANII